MITKEMTVWIFITLWILILAFNAVYSFLPTRLQDKTWIRISAIVAALVILVYGVYEVIKRQQDKVFAYVSSDGAIQRSKNFPWKISKSTTSEGEVAFIIADRFGDASELSIALQGADCPYTKYIALDGLGIKFHCPENEIPPFMIEIRR